MPFHAQSMVIEGCFIPVVLHKTQRQPVVYLLEILYPLFQKKLSVVLLSALYCCRISCWASRSINVSCIFFPRTSPSPLATAANTCGNELPKPAGPGATPPLCCSMPQATLGALQSNLQRHSTKYNRLHRNECWENRAAHPCVLCFHVSLTIVVMKFCA